MTEAEVKEFLDANPDSINLYDRSRKGQTALYAAVASFKSVPLIAWLIDDKGADVNRKAGNGETPAHGARSLHILNALLDRGADPTKRNDVKYTPLMQNALHGRVKLVARLLEDPRVRATADLWERNNHSALFLACYHRVEANATPIVRLLLEANANPILPDRNKKETPVAFLRRLHPNHHTTIAALEAAIGRTEATLLLINTRRHVSPETNTAAQLSYVRRKITKLRPEPQVVLRRVLRKGEVRHRVTAACDDTDEEGIKVRNLFTFVIGLGGGPRAAGMPPEVFRIVMDHTMPSWDPLRTLVGAKKVTES